MSTAVHFQAEKAELDAVLESGIFNRAPGLANFLRYVCCKYFEGLAEQIKEYNIAVEALGRPPEFDQRKDSIVRVEAHRLRKRLKEYYAGAGADHVLQIVIPQGQYVPQFLVRNLIEPPPESADNIEVKEEAPVPEIQEATLTAEPVINAELTAIPETPTLKIPVRAGNRKWLWASALSALLIAGAYAHFRTTSPAMQDWAINPGSDVRILAGYSGSPFVDHQGRVWSPDRFFVGGSPVRTNHQQPIYRTQDPTIYRTQREGEFAYEIPLPQGVYELHLFFAETVFGEGNQAGGGEASRLFNIKINGNDSLTVFDVLSDAGAANTVEEKVFRDVSPAGDGKLHIQFVNQGHDLPFVNAIEILPGIPGKIRPIRITTRHTPYTDREGRLWDADRDFFGGSSLLRTVAVQGTSDPQVYTGERFGNFSYSVAVPPGRYGVTLKFVENYFGSDSPGGGGIGSRLFDVFCNGLALLRNFDIFAESGGSHKALDKTFHGLKPNAQGKLVFQFVPVKNYACLSALEVVDESE